VAVSMSQLTFNQLMQTTKQLKEDLEDDSDDG
jgi:hypothetical protein